MISYLNFSELNSEPTFYTVYPNGEMLSAEDLEFQMVQNHFLKNLPKDSQTEITSVEFVTNPALQQKYEDKKSEFKTNGIPDEEIFAYHGNFAKFDFFIKKNGILFPKLF